MIRLCLLLFLSMAACSRGGAASVSRNLFGELLGKTEAETTAHIEAVWRQFTQGDASTERLYYETPEDSAYIADIGNGDVRSEGMSYGMMIAVQLDRREQFDRLWRWACRHMRHAQGPKSGYFAWQCRYDGTKIGRAVSASDGEVWIATALLFASRRWGDGEGIFNYSAEAAALLRAMREKPRRGKDTAIFDRDYGQVTFCPFGDASRITDPSYHLPAFYMHWAAFVGDPASRAFWNRAAAESRAFFHRNAHPETGLMSEYAHFDGRPYAGARFGPGKDEFGFDAWRTLAFVALDHAWGSGDAWQVERTDRVLRFLAGQGDGLVNRYTLDGRPLGSDYSPGLVAMAAAAGVAASDPELARPFVQRLWDAPAPTGRWRYYDGLLTMLGLLQTSGRFQSYEPFPALSPSTSL